MFLIIVYRLSNILPEPFLHWCEKSAIGAYLVQSQKAFAISEIFHIMDLMMLLVLTCVSMRNYV